MKKRALVAGVVVVAVAFSGCASIQKKFTRHAKEPAHKPVTVFVDSEGGYQKKYSNEYYYKTHFTLWTSWHEELMSNLDGNQKKAQRCAQETWNHLEGMSLYLNEEKKKELAPLKDDFEDIYRRISKGSFRNSDLPMFRAELEKLGRIIAANFYYNKVKDALVPDQVDLS